MSAIVVLAAPLGVTALAVTGTSVGDALDAFDTGPLTGDERATVREVESAWQGAPATIPATVTRAAADLGATSLAGSARPVPARRAEPAPRARDPRGARSALPARVPAPAAVLPPDATPTAAADEPAADAPAAADPPPPVEPVEDEVPPPPDVSP